MSGPRAFRILQRRPGLNSRLPQPQGERSGVQGPRVWRLLLSRKTRKEIRCFGKSHISRGREHLVVSSRSTQAPRTWVRSRVGRIRGAGRANAAAQESAERFPAGLTNCKQIASNETDLPVVMLLGRWAVRPLNKLWQFVEEGETQPISAGLCRAPGGGCQAWRWQLEPGKEIRDRRGPDTTRTLVPGLYNSKRPRKWMGVGGVAWRPGERETSDLRDWK